MNFTYTKRCPTSFIIRGYKFKHPDILFLSIDFAKPTF